LPLSIHPWVTSTTRGFLVGFSVVGFAGTSSGLDFIGRHYRMGAHNQRENPAQPRTP
jgi:hypothetical protein